MKPRNNKEKRLVELQSKFHAVYKRDIEWVSNQHKNLKRKGWNAEYFGILDTCEEYQVVRWLMNVDSWRKLEAVEVMQMWIDTEHVYYFTKSRQCLGNYYIDPWCMETPLEFRGHYDNQTWISRDLRLLSFTHMRIHKLQPCFKYGGLEKCHLLSEAPYYILKYLANPHFCTIEQNHIGVAGFCKRNWKELETIFTAFKITLRAKYSIEDANLWCDYILLLKKNGLDIHNRAFVCPDDIHHAHDWAMQLETARIERKNKDVMKLEQVKFLKHHKDFLGIAFANGNLSLHSLDSVAEYITEGHIMGHCVGHLCKYYEKPDSLILTCNCEGKKIATIEVNIPSLKIVQIQGRKNTTPPHYEEIKKLVEANLGLVAERKSRHAKSA